MTELVIDVFLSRSNPLVLRRLAMGEDRTLAELCRAVAIALGRECAPARCPDLTLREAFAEGPISMEIQLTEGRQPELEVQAILRSERKGGTGVPMLLSYTGPNVPLEAAGVRHLNDMLQNAGIDSRALLQSSTACDPRRVAYDLTKVFDPEHMPQQVDLSMGVTVVEMLQQLRVDELKAIAKYANVYYYNPIRKAELIVTIAAHWSADRVRMVLERQLSLREYMKLRQHVTRAAVCRVDDLQELAELGLVQYSPDGPRIAQQLVSCMDSLFETPAEEKMLERLRFVQSIQLANLLYGVYPATALGDLYERLNGHRPKKQMLTDYLEARDQQREGAKIRRYTEGVLFDFEMLTRNEATTLWSKVKNLPQRRLPTPEEAAELEHHGLVPPCQELGLLVKMLTEKMWLSYEHPNSVASKLLYDLFKGASPEKAMERLHTHSYRGQSIRGELLELLYKLQNMVPLALLGGYTLSGYRKAGLGDPDAMLNRR